MKVHLAGEFPCGGKQLLLKLSKLNGGGKIDEIISCWRNERESLTLLPRSDGGGNFKEAVEKMNVFLAGNDVYHKNEKWLTEAQNEMKKIFLAGSESRLRWVTKEVTSFEDFNILESYYTLREKDDFMQLLTRCNSFLLDSGAFTFMQGTHQGKIDWDEYIDGYAELINRWDVKLFFELDIDSIVGLDEVNRLRRKLEVLTNKQPIPVWHKNRGKDYFIRMCEEYKYVAIGGIVTREIPKNIYEKMFPWFIKTAHTHGCKIHGLGYTIIKGLHQYRFDSVDSTAWLYGNRGGYLYKFKPDTGMIEQIKPENRGRLKPRAAALNNFIEWVKFCKYAEKYL